MSFVEDFNKSGDLHRVVAVGRYSDEVYGLLVRLKDCQLLARCAPIRARFFRFVDKPPYVVEDTVHGELCALYDFGLERFFVPSFLYSAVSDAARMLEQKKPLDRSHPVLAREEGGQMTCEVCGHEMVVVVESEDGYTAECPGCGVQVTEAVK